MKVGSYCRVQGLQSEKGKPLNGRVGEIVLDATIFTSLHTPSVTGIGFGNEVVFTENGRVPVLIDGEWEAKLLKPENLKIMKGAGEGEHPSERVEHYNATWSFDPSDPCHCNIHVSHTASEMSLVSGGFRCGHIVSPFIAILIALETTFSKVPFGSPTVVHVPDVNVATALNKFLAGIPEFEAVWAAREAGGQCERTQTFLPILKKIVKILKDSQHDTFFKWSPIQKMQKPHIEPGTEYQQGVHEITAGVESGEWEEPQSLKEAPYNPEDFPLQFAFMPAKEGPPLDYDKLVDVMDKIFKGIYSIYPQCNTKNCYDVIYASDGECDIQVGSFMDWGMDSIDEWQVFSKICLGDTYQTAQAVYAGQPMLFWHTMMHLEAHRKEWGDASCFTLFPFLSETPANNRKLLAKRTTAKEDSEGIWDLDDLLRLGAANADVSAPISAATKNNDWEEKTDARGERMARIGALTVMVELSRRTLKPLTFQIPQHWEKTSLAQDVEAALALINDGRKYHEAACVLLGESVCCAFCGVEENQDAGIKLLRCTGCGVASYCGRECQKKDFKPKHKALCKTLKQERLGLPMGKEKDYLQHLQEMAPKLFASANARLGGYRR